MAVRSPRRVADPEKQSSGRWDAAYAPQARAKVAAANRYAVLYRIQQAKGPEKRAAKIGELVERLALGESIIPAASPTLRTSAFLAKPSRETDRSGQPYFRGAALRRWIPAFAGMTCAGMTCRGYMRHSHNVYYGTFRCGQLVLGKRLAPQSLSRSVRSSAARRADFQKPSMRMPS
jgi:hypothetical protein